MDDQRYHKLRGQMIIKQLIPRGINDERVLEAFRKVPRHLFVDSRHQAKAYGDYPLSIGLDQTISQPYIVALMTQSLELKGHEKILEIGTGSGYQTAILSELVEHVYTMERLPSLSEKAAQTLQELGYQNISFRSGDGTGGWPDEAPFNGILVAAAAAKIPQTLLDQLASGGRMVIPVGSPLFQKLTLVIKDETDLKEQNICGCRFVPLIGSENTD
ncbi:MAG: protein-L-isoaspartate(D-aspartate) O-methyltransferase [Bacillota bacterium]|nr:protein-L-isoaspartate(D-aspartate) O-methyltransferase [Bacillota bacterium]